MIFNKLESAKKYYCKALARDGVPQYPGCNAQEKPDNFFNPPNYAATALLKAFILSKKAHKKTMTNWMIAIRPNLDTKSM
jgi:hypothetical protein